MEMNGVTNKKIEMQINITLLAGKVGIKCQKR
jgi:hypothetical protein